MQTVEQLLLLMRLTADDANFQAWVKSRVEYGMDRGEKCKTYLSTQMQKKEKAGYYSKNVDHSALEFMKLVLRERTDEPTL